MSKTCPCGKPITKGYFKKCFECNNKDKVDSDDEEVKPDDTIPYKKMSIPKTVKNCLWINTYGDSRIGKCKICLREDVSLSSFQACHILAEKNGGSCSLDNLMVGCALCNSSMGTANALDFIKTYNLHFGLKKIV
jgi:hypothetical protein